jgi:L-alanine-DL-glutamate epimerase-like enolase superfamily enzyme
MKISAIEAMPFRLPTRRDFKWTGLNEQLGGFVLVRVRTDDGIIGYGEATPLPDWGGDFGRRGGETIAGVAYLIEKILASRLIGADPTNVTAARAVMDVVVAGNSYAKNAIDMALHDIWGKSVGLPIYKLLGGAVRSSVPVAHMVGLMDETEALREAAEAVAEGIGTLQIKGGVDAARDVRLIAVLRKEFGAKVTLRLDANQGYGAAKTAIHWVKALEDVGVDLVEQPARGLLAMAEVVAAVSTPIIADESCWDVHDALDVSRKRAADCFSIYLAKAGGFAGARKVAAVAEAEGLPCDVNGSIESAIGNAANVQFALATPSVTLASVIPINAPDRAGAYKTGGNYFLDDVCTEPFPVKDGSILSLDAPGLGIQIDERKLEKWRQAQ